MKRRKFIKTTAIGILPLMLDNWYLKAMASDTIWGNAAAATTDTDHVLVIVQLVGGNDGLNTIVPLDQYSKLSSARSNVLIAESKLLKATGFDTIGFHPSISALKNLFTEGKLNIIQNVGYPQQNYSHFRSTDIWMSASDSDKNVPTGWAGRYLNYEYTNYPTGYPNQTMPDPLGIQIGSMLSLGMMGPNTTMGMAISNPNDVFTRTTGIPDAAPSTPAGVQLTYLRELAQQTGKYTTVVYNAAQKITNQVTYPANNELAAQLKVVAKLIAGGLKTRVYMVSLGGFDTHSIQTEKTATETGIHANLLKKVSEAVDAFVKDCAYLGIDDKVVGLTMSEFGRRIKSNDSQGSDHGAAAPLFLFGKPVKGNKIIGSNPVIPTNTKVEDNVPMQYDFRSIYSTILQDWFCLPQAETDNLLMKNFPKLDLFAKPCGAVSVHEVNKSGEALLECYPNPFTTSTNVRFTSDGGQVLVEVFDYYGRNVALIENRVLKEGDYNVSVNLEHLSAGNYYVRLQNGLNSQVKYIQKVR